MLSINQETSKLYHYTYKITHPSGEYYLGRRTSKTHPETDSYMGSGVWVNSISDKSCLKKEIIDTYTNQSTLITEELKLIKHHIKNVLCKNLVCNSGGISKMTNITSNTLIDYNTSFLDKLDKDDIIQYIAGDTREIEFIINKSLAHLSENGKEEDIEKQLKNYFENTCSGYYITSAMLNRNIDSISTFISDDYSYTCRETYKFLPLVGTKFVELESILRLYRDDPVSLIFGTDPLAKSVIMLQKKENIFDIAWLEREEYYGKFRWILRTIPSFKCN